MSEGFKMEIFNSNCPCENLACPNHGNCTACRERHRTVEGIDPLPYCERPANKEKLGQKQ